MLCDPARVESEDDGIGRKGKASGERLYRQAGLVQPTANTIKERSPREAKEEMRRRDRDDTHSEYAWMYDSGQNSAG